MATTLKIQNTFHPNGVIFEVERAAAEHSVVINMLLQDMDGEDLANMVIPISIDVSDRCLSKVFKWVRHHKNDAKLAADNADPVPRQLAEEEEKKKKEQAKPANPPDEVNFTAWDDAFFATVDSQMLYEILYAANYLDINPLYEMGCEVVANMIRGKSAEEIRTILGIEDDLTAEEKKAIEKEKTWLFVNP